MRSAVLLLTTLLAATPPAARAIVFDPHLDLPRSAIAPDWTGRGDPSSQFALERRAVATLQTAFGLSASGGAALSPARRAEYDRRFHEIVGREPKASVADLMQAVDYAVKRIGIDHVALSSDFSHGGGVTGWNDVAGTASVTAALERHGHTPARIAQPWGGTATRVWRAAIGACAPGDPRKVCPRG